MSFPLNLERLFSSAAPLPLGGQQHLRAIWEAHCSESARARQQRLIWRLSVVRAVILVLTLIGSLAALSQYQYFWVFPIYVLFKMLVMRPLSQGIDQQLIELQDDPNSDLWHGRAAMKVGARLMVLLLLTLFWIVLLIGRAQIRARMSLQKKIILQGREYSPDEIVKDSRYRATIAAIHFLECNVSYQHRTDFAGIEDRSRAHFLSWLIKTQDQTTRDLGTLVASFELHPLGTPELADHEVWTRIELQATDYARTFEVPVA